MTTLIELNSDHPVIDAIAKNIASLTSQPNPVGTYAEDFQQVTQIATLYEKQVTTQRALMLTRLQTIFAYKQSNKNGGEAKLPPETIKFCEELGIEDWRTCPMNDLLSSSKWQLQKAKYEWIRSKVYCMIVQGELITELKRSDFENMFADQQQGPASNTQ